MLCHGDGFDTDGLSHTPPHHPWDCLFWKICTLPFHFSSGCPAPYHTILIKCHNRISTAVFSVPLRWQSNHFMKKVRNPIYKRLIFIIYAPCLARAISFQLRLSMHKLKTRFMIYTHTHTYICIIYASAGDSTSLRSNTYGWILALLICLDP